jgi:hypothetical protein
VLIAEKSSQVFADLAGAAPRGRSPASASLQFVPARGPDLGKMLAAVNEQRAATGEAAFTGPTTEASLGMASLAAVSAALAAGREPVRATLRTAVRFTLDALAARAPGRSVEVRIPPLAAVQCVPGPRHTRGTPANVVETDPLTWLDLASGRLAFAAAVDSGRLRASGPRADISAYLPLVGGHGDSKS